jgi:hypothetical protein
MPLTQAFIHIESCTTISRSMSQALFKSKNINKQLYE